MSKNKVLAICHCMNIRHAGNKITSMYGKYLEPLGISNGQYSILSVIKNTSPINVSGLAEKMSLDRTTLVRSIKVLENKNLICDVATKGRSRQLELTESGENIYSEANECWKKAQSELEKKLGSEQMEQFNDILEKIINL